MCCIEAPPTIATERLQLRAVRKADAGRIAKLANDEDVVRMTSRLPWPYSLEDAQTFVDQVTDQHGATEKVFAIEHPGEGLIGMLGFSPAEHGAPEIGYWLGRDYWGQGYATEAATAALDWAAHGWRRKLVYAGHFADNRASGEVLIKAGFLYTGDVRQRFSVARGQNAATRMMVWLS